jgi:hypothetical protein
MARSNKADRARFKQPMAEVVRVLSAVSRGDLSERIPLEVGGRPLRGDFLR